MPAVATTLAATVADVSGETSAAPAVLQRSDVAGAHPPPPIGTPTAPKACAEGHGAVPLSTPPPTLDTQGNAANIAGVPTPAVAVASPNNTAAAATIDGTVRPPTPRPAPTSTPAGAAPPTPPPSSFQRRANYAVLALIIAAVGRLYHVTDGNVTPSDAAAVVKPFAHAAGFGEAFDMVAGLFVGSGGGGGGDSGGKKGGGKKAAKGGASGDGTVGHDPSWMAEVLPPALVSSDVRAVLVQHGIDTAEDFYRLTKEDLLHMKVATGPANRLLTLIANGAGGATGRGGGGASSQQPTVVVNNYINGNGLQPAVAQGGEGVGGATAPPSQDGPQPPPNNRDGFDQRHGHRDGGGRRGPTRDRHHNDGGAAMDILVDQRRHREALQQQRRDAEDARSAVKVEKARQKARLLDRLFP